MEENKDLQEETKIEIDAGTLADYNKNHVSKEEYERVVAEKNEMVKAVLNGTYEAQQQQNKEEFVDINKTAEYLYGDPDRQFKATDYIKNVLELRKAVIHRDGIDNDPFLPIGHDITVTDAERMQAQRVADKFEEWLELANGDDEDFIRLLQKDTKEALPPNVVANLVKQKRLK